MQPNYPHPPRTGQYAPPAAQQGYPQYAPQPGYPAPSQAAPPLPAPPQPQPAAFVMPNIVEPGAGGGGGDWSPNPRHLIGYAAVILPTAYDPNNQGPGGQVKAQITADFVVVNVGKDGALLPPIEFGDNRSHNMAEQRPNCFRVDAFPAEFRGARWTNNEIVKHLAPLVGTGNITMGRFRIGDTGNRPPLFERMDDNDPARAVLLEAWQQRTMNPGSLKRSVGAGIVEINGGPPQKAPAAGQPQQQGMPPQPGSAYAQVAQQYGAPAQQAYAAGAQGQQWGGPVAPPMPPQPGQPPQQVAYGPPPAQPGAPAPMPPAAAQAGWTQEAWNNAPPQVKAAFGG